MKRLYQECRVPRGRTMWKCPNRKQFHRWQESMLIGAGMQTCKRFPVFFVCTIQISIATLAEIEISFWCRIHAYSFMSSSCRCTAAEWKRNIFNLIHRHRPISELMLNDCCRVYSVRYFCFSFDIKAWTLASIMCFFAVTRAYVQRI